MNLCEVVKESQKLNCGFRQKDWTENCYAFHGIDNLLHISNNGQIQLMSMAVATLMAEDWTTFQAVPYHGTL